MSYLPSAHVVDRWTCHWWASMTHGFTVTSIGDMRTVILMLPGLRPTTWGGVPRIWEKLQHTLTSQGIDDPAALGEEARAELRVRLGFDRVEHLGGGAAPMPIDVLRYFDALGLPIAEAWGMSETAGAGTANPPGAIRHGTCGTALPGVELRLADDAELLVRGPVVMRGYRERPRRDGGRDRRRGVAAHRRRRPHRRRRLRVDHRPQEGADHQRRGQEHVAREHRGRARRPLAADRARRRGRRPPALRRRARRARPRRRGRLRGRARPRRRLGRRAVRRSRAAAGDPRRDRRRQRAALAGGADQGASRSWPTSGGRAASC